MKLTDIRDNPEILSQLRWDLTPQTATVTDYTIKSQEDLDNLNRLLAEKAGYYFYVDVWNCQARLAIMHNYPNGNGTAETITDFPDEDLLYEAADNLGCSGHYPITKAIENVLRAFLYAPNYDSAWTVEKDALRRKLNAEYAKNKRDKDRLRKYSPKKRTYEKLIRRKKNEQ